MSKPNRLKSQSVPKQNPAKTATKTRNERKTTLTWHTRLKGRLPACSAERTGLTRVAVVYNILGLVRTPAAVLSFRLEISPRISLAVPHTLHPRRARYQPVHLVVRVCQYWASRRRAYASTGHRIGRGGFHTPSS
eukprot:2789766-Rhodomonas_salina.3